MIEVIPNWHPIFVHFTVALFSVSTGLYVLGLLIPDGKLKGQWRTVARWNLWFGMGLTVITVLSGIYAYNTVAHDTPSHLAMSDHRNWAIATAALFAAATLWSVLSYRAGKAVSTLFIALLVIASVMLGATAWRGGEVVYRYGIGVMSLPNTDSHGHSSDVSEHPHDGRTEADSHPVSADEDVTVNQETSPDTTQDTRKTEPNEHHDDSTPHTH